MIIAAILVKTKGNGGVNDFTREYTCATIAATLAPYLHAWAGGYVRFALESSNCSPLSACPRSAH